MLENVMQDLFMRVKMLHKIFFEYSLMMENACIVNNKLFAGKWRE